MENTIANIRILDVVRLVHGYFIFVFLIINTKEQTLENTERTIQNGQSRETEWDTNEINDVDYPSQK